MPEAPPITNARSDHQAPSTCMRTSLQSGGLKGFGGHGYDLVENVALVRDFHKPLLFEVIDNVRQTGFVYTEHGAKLNKCQRLMCDESFQNGLVEIGLFVE